MTRFFSPARTLAIAVLTVGVLGGAACSSDGSDDATKPGSATTTTASGSGTSGSGSTPEEQDFIDGFVTGVSKAGVITPDQGQCIGEAWADLIGVDALVEAGLTPEEFGEIERGGYRNLALSSTQTDELFEVLAPCGFDPVAGLRSASAGDVTPDQKACVGKVVTKESVRNAFAATLTEVDGQKKLDALQNDVTACLAG